MVLVRVVAAVGEDRRRASTRPLQLLEPVLDLVALHGKEAVAELGELDLAVRCALRGSRRPSSAPPSARAAGALSTHQCTSSSTPRCDPAEDRAAGADLDVVGMRAEAQDREAIARLGEAAGSS